MTEYASILDRITEGRELPEGTTHWALKATDFAGRTRGGFQWPDHGWVTAPNPDPTNTDACPIREGDGICVGLSHRGIAQGGHRALALMLVAFHENAALSPHVGVDKVRLSAAFVVERLDGERLIKDHGAGADLRGADLQGADLDDLCGRGAIL